MIIDFNKVLLERSLGDFEIFDLLASTANFLLKDTDLERPYVIKYDPKGDDVWDARFPSLTITCGCVIPNKFNVDGRDYDFNEETVFEEDTKVEEAFEGKGFRKPTIYLAKTGAVLMVLPYDELLATDKSCADFMKYFSTFIFRYTKLAKPEAQRTVLPDELTMLRKISYAADYANAIDVLTDWKKQYDYDHMDVNEWFPENIKKALKSDHESLVERKELALTEKRGEMKDLMDRYMRMIKETRELEDMIWGLKNRKECDLTEVIEFMLSCPAIKPVRCKYNEEIKFDIVTPLRNYDPKVYERHRDDDCSWFFPYNDDWTHDMQRQVLDHIIGENADADLMMCGFIDMNSSKVEAGDCTTEYEAIKNAHFSYACLGEFGPSIMDLMEEEDFVGAVNECIAAVASTNLSEEITQQKMFRRLFNDNPRCIRYNGKMYTAKEFYEVI